MCSEFSLWFSLWFQNCFKNRFSVLTPSFLALYVVLFVCAKYFKGVFFCLFFLVCSKENPFNGPARAWGSSGAHATSSRATGSFSVTPATLVNTTKLPHRRTNYETATPKMHRRSTPTLIWGGKLCDSIIVQRGSPTGRQVKV